MEGVEVELLTAQGQLSLASEFRFDVWHTEHEHEYITVKKGRRKLEEKWAISAGESEHGHFWDGDHWNFEIRGADAYVWELEPALVLARKLAFDMNQGVVDRQERRFPGEFRGGPYDQAAWRAE